MLLLSLSHTATGLAHGTALAAAAPRSPHRADARALICMKRRIEVIAHAATAGYGCTATIDWWLDEQPYYPPTIDYDGMVVFASQVCTPPEVVAGPKRCAL